MNHQLKTIPPFYQDVIEGKKRFEIRKDDRGFNVGDLIRLREYNPNLPLDPIAGKYTGRYCYVSVDYILRDFSGLEPGFCVMGITQRI